MKIYIAGTYSAHVRLRDRADQMRALGHDVLSDWMYEPARPAHLNIAEWNEELALKDIAQVYSADCILLDRDGESTTGGRYVEWGVACAPGALKRRYTVGGAASGVFDYLAHRHFGNWDDLLAYFQITHGGK